MPESKSGKLVTRLPVELHTLLAEEAARQGVSLNTLIVGFLSGAIGWRKP
jgi:predicted HicB family RNase H-like nuclease